MPRASTSVASRHCRRAPPVAETSADRHHPRCITAAATALAKPRHRPRTIVCGGSPRYRHIVSSAAATTRRHSHCHRQRNPAQPSPIPMPPANHRLACAPIIRLSVRRRPHRRHRRRRRPSPPPRHRNHHRRLRPAMPPLRPQSPARAAAASAAIAASINTLHCLKRPPTQPLPREPRLRQHLLHRRLRGTTASHRK